MSVSEQWLPEDGDGVIYVTYDERDRCQVTREAMTWLLKRGGFHLKTTEIVND